MAKGFKTGGRQPGTPNKVSKTMRESLQEVYEKLGGADGMAAWACGQPDEFYKLWIKMLPQDSNVNMTGNISWPLPKTGLDE